MHEYKSSLVTSLRLARQLSKIPRQDTLNNLPDNACPPDDYFLSIAKNGKIFDPFRIALKYCLNRETATTSLGGGFRRQELNRTKHSLNDAVDPELEGLVDSIYILRPISEKASGLDPEETIEGLEFLDISSDNENNKGRSKKDNHQRNIHYLSKIAMHNQRLKSRWEILTTFEISLFLDAVQKLSEGQFPYDIKVHKDHFIPPQELAAAALTLFLRATTDIGATTLHKDGKNINPPGYRYYENMPGCWIMSPARIDVDHRGGNKLYEQSERHREYLYVTSGTGLEQIVDGYIKNVRMEKRNPFSRMPESYFKRLFLKGNQTYLTNIDALIKKINEKHRTRLTTKRLALYLFDIISHHRGADITVAMLLTGKIDFLGKSQLHYTAFSAKKLQQIYKEVCSDIYTNHLDEIGCKQFCNREPIYTPSSTSNWGGTVGIPYRSRKSTVKRLVAGLQKRMVKIATMRPSIDKLLRIHNNMVRYTAILFSFSTGFRAIRSPILPPSQIDLDTGIAVISDKDGSDYYNSRIVWLPPVCIVQYQLYFEHLALLMPKLEHIDLSAFNKLKNLLAFTHPDDRLPLFFLIDKTGTSIQLRPTDLWGNIRENLQYNLPANASRHYLRSNLLERGCPPEIIAAFMGHWERGEEPWGRYSALSPFNYVKILSPYLVKLLEEDGWIPLSGLQEHW